MRGILTVVQTDIQLLKKDVNEMKTQMAKQDLEMKTQLAKQDLEMKTQLAKQDLEMKTQLASLQDQLDKIQNSLNLRELCLEIEYDDDDDDE